MTQPSQLSHPAQPGAPVVVDPPRRGMGLGFRLGLLTAVGVTTVMAAVSGVQLSGQIRSDASARQDLLRDSLAPLVQQLQAASTPQDATDALERFHEAYLVLGRSDHRVSLESGDGSIELGGESRANQQQVALLSAGVELENPRLAAGALTLRVTEDGTDLRLDAARRWRAWGAHVLLSAALTLAFLWWVVRHEVTGPIDRLVAGVRRMELGYWDDLADPGGAWELRWLAWRFGTLGSELSRTVEHLFAAQQRSIAAMRDPTRDPAWVDDEFNGPTPLEPGPAVDVDIAPISSTLDALRLADPAEPATRALALVAWDREAHRAGRLGRFDLRNEIEDAALAVLDPAGFGEVVRRHADATPALVALCRKAEAELGGALSDRGVPVVRLQSRIKHAAGAWRKMQQKDLAFEQVHDLVALRIVVPTESDCYGALATVHDLYSPIVGRFKDYIASPKPNGYRALHASVRDSEGAVFEVQVRSLAMHRQAEHGVASHAEYRDETAVPATERPATFLRRVLRRLVPG